MKTKLQVIHSHDYNPYFNLALEELLVNSVAEDTIILYLWQNEHTVVIGRNQNAWKECRVNVLEEDQGHLARRLSGGGTVYHDLGNLNFTFIMNINHYQVERQLNVILGALAMEGIVGYKSGRNDLLIDEKKFSGNAYYHSGSNAYHHGTILVDVDIDQLGKYLSVSMAKLKGNGVDSVKSRVMNLKEVIPDITIETMKEHLVKAFEAEYQGVADSLSLTHEQINQLISLTQRYESKDWIFQKNIKTNFEIMDQFTWGEFHLLMEVEEDIVKDCIIYSDAIDVGLVQKIVELIKHNKFSGKSLVSLLEPLKNTYNEKMVSDIQHVLLKNVD